MEKQMDTVRQGGPSQEVTPQEKVSFDKVYFEWDANEYIHEEKNTQWYVTVLVISLLVLAYIIYTRDWLMIPVVVLVDVAIYFYSKKKPRRRHYKITRSGLYMDEYFFSFDSMHSFWIVYNQKVQAISFMFLKKYLPALTLQLEGLDPLKLKLFLKQLLPEQEKREELFVDKILRILKM